ncbi:hypothetical protein [Ornithinimicrobium cavernae]|uniref:hypothetical protein n=1 Tax=Ornithinimicrobium cavernae TaxID=2666047 RepID=UPI0012B1699F|nr:hypothetical protein [Ornithinimicrobium cavernae]
MRTARWPRIGALGTAATLALTLTACGGAAPDTEQVSLPPGFGEHTAAPETPTASQPPVRTRESAGTTQTPTTEATEAPTASDHGDAAPTTPPPPAAAPPTSQPPAATGPTPPEGGGVPIGCSTREEVAFEAGQPASAGWGDAVEVESALGDRFSVVVDKPTIRETDFRLPEEPPLVWEAEVTARHVSGMGFTSITDFVLLDPSGSQCAIAWADTTLWGLMVYDEGDVESGTAAFLVPTSDISDYRLVFVGSDPAVARHVWEE